MRRLLAAAVAALLVAACGGSSSNHTITGTMSLRVPGKTMQTFRSGGIGNPSRFAVGAPCLASDYSEGYADLDEGAAVTVKNEKDVVVATGRLGPGLWTSDACQMPFTISDVPEASFYAVEVGRRGVQRYSKAEMEEAKWVVELVVTDT